MYYTAEKPIFQGLPIIGKSFFQKPPSGGIGLVCEYYRFNHEGKQMKQNHVSDKRPTTVAQ